MCQYNVELTIDEAIESSYIMQKSEQHRLTPKYDIIHSFPPLVKHYHVTEEDDGDKLFKTTSQLCNGFVRRYGKMGELLYFKFCHADVSILGLYPGDIFLENCFFQWPGRIKRQCIHHRISKKGNVYHKYSRFPDLQNKTLRFCMQLSHWIR